MSRDGTLRRVLSETTEDTVTISSSVSSITITGWAISPYLHNNNKTILDGGSLQLTGNNVTYAQGWTLTDNADNRIGVTTGITATLSGKLIGTNSGFTKSSDGILILSSGTNDYTGATTITVGTLKLTGSGSIADSKQFPVDLEDPEKNRVFLIETNAGLIGGAGILTQAGEDKLILNASGSEVGAVKVNAGRFIVGGRSDKDTTTLKTNVTVASGSTLGGHGKTLGASVEAAWRVSSPNETITAEPYAALTHHRLSLDGFEEKGDSAALKTKRETATHTQSTLGLRLSTSPTARVTFDAEVAWQHLFGNPTPKTIFTRREGNQTRFITSGAPVNKDAALLGLSVGMKITKNSNLRLQYQGELGSRGQNHEGQVVLEIKW
jgi:autotransporter-associated beta strand protein